MRTKKVLITAILAVCLMVLAGCDLSSVTKLEFYNQPKVEYVQNEDVKNENVIIRITYSNGKNELKEVALTSFKGFQTANLGSFTATYTNGGVNISFDYTVVVDFTGNFAGGNGSVSDPFIIMSTAQFKLLNTEETNGKYFKLGADITITDADYSSVETDVLISVKSSFKGVLDGDGNTIYMTNELLSYERGLIGKTSGNATIKNLNVHITGMNTLVMNISDSLTIENVIIRGNSNSGHNYAPFTGNVSGNLTLRNCINYANIVGTTGNSSGFCGFPNSANSSISFENCQNYGNITALSAAAFVHNPSRVANVTLDDKCTNSGNITTLGGRGDITAVPGIIAPGFEKAATEKMSEDMLKTGLYHQSKIVKIADSWGEDNQLKITETDGDVSYYVVQIGISVEVELYGYTGTARFYNSKAVQKNANNITDLGTSKLGAYAYTGKEDVKYDTGFPIVTIEGIAYYTYTNLSNYTLKGNNVSYKVFAYDSNNSLIKIYQND